MPRGRPRASCLRQVEAYLKDMGMTGLASAWVMSRHRVEALPPQGGCGNTSTCHYAGSKDLNAGMSIYLCHIYCPFWYEVVLINKLVVYVEFKPRFNFIVNS